MLGWVLGEGRGYPDGRCGVGIMYMRSYFYQHYKTQNLKFEEKILGSF